MISDMLLDNFYTIRHIEKTDSDWTVTIDLNPDHVIYKGHFPEQPIVPGVCMLQMIKESAEKMVNSKLQFAQIASCKFLSAIDPVESSVLELSIKWEEAEEGFIKLQAGGICNETEFVKVKASLIKK